MSESDGRTWTQTIDARLPAFRQASKTSRIGVGVCPGNSAVDFTKINGFSPNVRAIIERFKFPEQIACMAEKDLLYLVIQQFVAIDLSPDRVDNVQMGCVFEELVRIGAEQSNGAALIQPRATPRRATRPKVITDSIQ